jgi:acyl-[acyl-carrier-protein]-phospholipid O-acyltransferase/long-chain-fatty-acid--[acyl-carrier-protein] ligase
MKLEQPLESKPKPVSPAAEKQDRLFTRGFVALLNVSFFGAANDNVLKQILMLMVVAGGLWANRLGPGTQGYISLVLTIPFVLLSGYAGQLADKFGKRDVILGVKIAEVPIAIFALLGLYFENFWLSLFALLLLAVQSSFYGPAKFGIIPDVVKDQQLSRANGLINAISNVAVILGSMIAGPLTSMYYPTTLSEPASAAVATLDSAGEQVATTQSVTPADANKSLSAPTLIPDPTRKPQRLPIGLVMVGVSLLGLIAAFRMPKTRAVDPELKFSGDFFGPHIQTFKDASRPLLVVMFSWSGFYLIGALALMLLPEYQSILGVSPTAITNLVGLLAISIMVGSVAVGFLSGKTIRPYFSLAGAIGMTICFATMGLAPMTYTLLAILVFLVGIFAGFYIVPLQSLLQFLSPTDERGRFFGTANALSFVFISAAGIIYIGLSRLGLPPEKIPLACAALAAVGTFVGMLELNRITAAQKSTSDSV